MGRRRGIAAKGMTRGAALSAGRERGASAFEVAGVRAPAVGGKARCADGLG